MHIPLRQQFLEETIYVIELVRPLVASVARRDRDLASQIRRALSSIALNLAEGFGSAAGNERLRFQSARGSLYETQAGIRVAVAWGFLSRETAAPSLAALDHLGGRIFGLLRA
jgi:four helix bundle protein